VNESESQRARYSRVLQRSVETRMRAIQEKLSIAFTFCSTVEIEVRHGELDRAKQLLHKLRTTVETLTVHINNPEHVTGEQAREFKKQLVQLRKKVLKLDSETEQRRF